MCHTCKTHYPDTEIQIFLTPCQYATGFEKEIAETLPLVKKVYSPKETIKHIFSWPIRKNNKAKGAVLFLGGDPLYSQALGIKHKLPVYGYHEREGSLGIFFKKSFSSKSIGNLMADKITEFPPKKNIILNKLKLEDKPYTLFFASSRPKQFEALFPLLCDTIQELKKQDSTLNPIINISPFISKKQVEKIKKKSNLNNIVCLQENSIEVMSIAKWLITIPGTNTAEAAYMKLPMIVLIPLNNPELLIFDGLGGLLSHIPLFGAVITQSIITVLKKKGRMYSQPNLMLNEPIIPEIIETIIPEKLAKTLLNYLQSEEEHQKIYNKLLTLPKPESVSLKICKEIIN